MEKISIETHLHTELIEITRRVQETVEKSKIKNGICFLYIPHTTASIFINENADPSVREDIESHLQRLVPERGNYQHLEGNSPGHIKSSIIGSSLSIFIENGGLLLGTWQGIYFAEFDGPRRREVWIKIIEGLT